MPSRRNRATRFSSFVISGCRSLSATLRPVASWMPRYTAPNPPSPIFDSTLKRLLRTWSRYISSPLGRVFGLRRRRLLRRCAARRPARAAGAPPRPRRRRIAAARLRADGRAPARAAPAAGSRTRRRIERSARAASYTTGSSSQREFSQKLPRSARSVPRQFEAALAAHQQDHEQDDHDRADERGNEPGRAPGLDRGRGERLDRRRRHPRTAGRAAPRARTRC